MQNKKISICTVTMNRLHHLKNTLIANIKANSDYDLVEFIVLDYGSTDETRNWIKKNLNNYILNNTLKYYYNPDVTFFDRSHSRNQMFRLADGEIICNVDADNYTGEGFASYVNTIFSEQEDIFLVADTQKRYYFLRNAFGRFCIKKTDYEAIGGLDENMKSYGSETLDLYERLTLLGKKEVVIEDTSYLNTISHGDEERISNEYFIKNLHILYINYINSNESTVLVLYKNGEYEHFTIIPEQNLIHLPAALKPDSYHKGTWQQVDESCILFNQESSVSKFLMTNDKAHFENDSEHVYYQITDSKFILQVAKNFSFIVNTDLSNKNKDLENYLANKGTFGQGIVIKNFDEEIVLN